jgi:hypothetical protein
MVIDHQYFIRQVKNQVALRLGAGMIQFDMIELEGKVVAEGSVEA